MVKAVRLRSAPMGPTLFCGEPNCRYPLNTKKECPYGHHQELCRDCGYPMVHEGSLYRCHNCCNGNDRE